MRHLSDDAALAAATAENGAREDISVAEEARLAKRAVSLCEGDGSEAAKLLGWKPSGVDARLMLLHACDDVLVALERRQIKVGHAELLSTLPKATQEGTLEKIVTGEFTSDTATGATSHKLYAGLLATTPQRREFARMALLSHLLGEHTSAMSHQVNWQNMAQATVADRQSDLTQTFMLIKPTCARTPSRAWKPCCARPDSMCGSTPRPATTRARSPN